MRRNQENIDSSKNKRIFNCSSKKFMKKEPKTSLAVLLTPLGQTKWSSLYSMSTDLVFDWYND